MKYETTIGLEIHVELNTRTKMFCSCLNDPNEKHPNINICPVCMGHPGTLPVANEEAVKKVILAGLALNGGIAEFSQFDRKNYFYPDLPKGYQISQYQHPLVKGGHLDLTNGRRIRITRIHLEEDTGRLIHDKETGVSLVDFNRAGMPLMELVTEPDLHSSEEVKEFGEELRKILRYLGTSNADMEKGQMRVEVNISLRPESLNNKLQATDKSQIPNPNDPSNRLGTKVEIKNINSFKFAADAVEYETKRQIEKLERGERVTQETRGWDEDKGKSFLQRSKEEAHDYRYFPEPDIPPLKISRELVEELRFRLPELPEKKWGRFAKEYGLKQNIIKILVREKALADYFERVISEALEHDHETPERPGKNLAEVAASLLTGEFLRLLKEASAPVENTRITPENFAELVLYIAENKISNLAAKKVLEEMFRSGDDPSDIIDRMGLWQMSDRDDLENIAEHVLKENPRAVEDHKKGKEASLQFLVGRVMQETRGKANPQMVQEIIKKLL